MASNSPDPGQPRARGWLARLTGMMQTSKADDDKNPDELMPAWDSDAPPETPTAPVSEAVPVATAAPAPPGATPVAVALPVQAEPAQAEPVEAEAAPAAPPEAPPEAEAAPMILCPVCGSPHQGRDPHCGDCGYYFSPADLVPRAAGAAPAAPAEAEQPRPRLKDRFEVRERISERQGVRR